MKRTLQYVLNTTLAGFFILLPFAFILLVVVSVFARIRGLADQLAEAQFQPGQVSPLLIALLAGFALFLILFLTGVLVSAGAAGKGSSWLEENFLNYIPGYLLVKGLANGLIGTTMGSGVRPVLLERIPGFAEMGYVMEELADERCAVFVPFSPNVGTGKVWIVDRAKVEFLDAGFMDVREALSLFGVGAGKALAGREKKLNKPSG